MLTAHDLSVVVVLHNSAGSVAAAVASVPPDAELVLVDSGSSDDGLAHALDAQPAALSALVPNRGFGAGCNVGARIATRPLLMFLNPDAELLPGSVERLLEALDRNPGSIVGPNHLDGNGAVVANSRRRSHPWHELAELLPSAERWLPDVLRRDVPAGAAIYRDGGSVPYLQGAAFVLAQQTLSAAGGFDERYFLYSEEEDLANRVRGLGGDSILVSDAFVRHDGGRSTGQVPTLALRHLYRSRVLFYASRDGSVRGLLFAAAVAGAASSRLVAGALRPRSFWRDCVWWASAMRGLASGVRECSSSS